MNELNEGADLVPEWSRRRSGRPWWCSSSARCGTGTGTAGSPDLKKEKNTINDNEFDNDIEDRRCLGGNVF